MSGLERAKVECLRERAAVKVRPTCLDRVDDPTGRLDVLAFGILKRSVSMQGNPAMTALFDLHQHRIAREIKKKFGPPRKRRRTGGKRK